METGRRDAIRQHGKPWLYGVALGQGKLADQRKADLVRPVPVPAYGSQRRGGDAARTASSTSKRSSVVPMPWDCSRTPTPKTRRSTGLAPIVNLRIATVKENMVGPPEAGNTPGGEANSPPCSLPASVPIADGFPEAVLTLLFVPYGFPLPRSTGCPMSAIGVARSM